VVRPADPKRAGYVLLGWFRDLNGKQKYDFDKEIVTSDFTIYALWDFGKYTVKFESNGGNKVQEQQVRGTAKVRQPANPSKPKMVFAGWYYNSELTDLWDFGQDVVKEDIMLYAKWVNALKLTFESSVSDFRLNNAWTPANYGEVSIFKSPHTSIMALVI
jgi:hypothetical protein